MAALEKAVDSIGRTGAGRKVKRSIGPGLNALVLSGLIAGFVAGNSPEARAETSASIDPAKAQRAATEDPMVCKKFTPTGSRIQRRHPGGIPVRLSRHRSVGSESLLIGSKRRGAC